MNKFLNNALKEIKTITDIYDWSVVGFESNNIDTKRIYIEGIIKIKNKKGIYKDKKIITSSLIKINNRVIKTRTNKLYKLKNINKEYREFLRKNDPSWNWKNPITL